MNNYIVDKTKKWDYENGFYLTCETNRLGKFINHLEIYKKILDLNGDVLEFGVFKGNSFSRFLSFRELLENNNKRTIIGFDAFGSFPNKIKSKRDLDFAKYHDEVCGYGIDHMYLNELLEEKGFNNFKLIKGDIIETLPEFLNSNSAIEISLLHIDVDIYKPTLLILELLWEKIVPGGILMLDDYDLIEGETIAVNEFFEGKDIFIHESKYHPSPKYIIKPKI